MTRITSLILLISYIATGCDFSSKSPEVRLAINPWPGYELLFVADRLGYFEEEGIKIKLLQLASLADVQRTFLQGRADGMASTAIEAIISATLNNEKLKIALMTDYSSGGDVIIAHKDIKSLKDLTNKTVGVEAGSLGIVVLVKALKNYGLTINDVHYVNREQLEMKNQLSQGKILAAVTYQPYATEILRDKNLHTVFTSREIPKEVIDIISIREEVLKSDPHWIKKFQKVWARALDYLAENPEQAIKIMADREGISVAEFKVTLEDLHLIQKDEIDSVMHEPFFGENIKSICQTLVELKTVHTDCGKISEMISSD